ncbi:MAG: LemA family protein [Gemmatimonadota bacterium]|jgi:LemA protein|nr:LemA family protein [Gemmatimonadota bacterium]
MTALIILLVLAVLVVFFVVGLYNKLVGLRNRYTNAFAQIDVQLKRRYDLIPNLVETVKGYMKHERETLEAVIAARNAAASVGQRVAANPGDAGAMRELAASDAALTGSLGKLFALSEAYPDLKASRNMESLQEELASTENKVAFARQGYNDAVMRYNTARESFPSSILAGMFGFAPAAAWMIEDPTHREAQRVSF